MKNEKANAEVVWKQIADLLIPGLRLSFVDRAMYFHPVRHSRLEGKARLHFSILWLADGTLVSSQTARESVRRLVAIGALRLIERTKAGHVVEVRLPEEIPAVRADRTGASEGTRPSRVADIEEIDFLEDQTLREAIYEREGGALLLPAAAHGPGAVPRPRCAACAGREQFLPEPGLCLLRVQLAKGEAEATR